MLIFLDFFFFFFVMDSCQCMKWFLVSHTNKERLQSDFQAEGTWMNWIYITTTGIDYTWLRLNDWRKLKEFDMCYPYNMMYHLFQCSLCGTPKAKCIWPRVELEIFLGSMWVWVMTKLSRERVSDNKARLMMVLIPKSVWVMTKHNLCRFVM